MILRRENCTSGIFSCVKRAFYESHENLLTMYLLSTLKYILYSKTTKLQMNSYNNPLVRHLYPKRFIMVIEMRLKNAFK